MTRAGVTVIDSPSLAERTSIRIGGSALAELRICGEKGLEQTPGLLTGLGGAPSVLGRGTNILAAEGTLPLVLLSLEDDGVQVAGEENGVVLLTVGAGLRLSVLLAKVASMGLSGLEGLAGIPGSVGGAAVMNAGSFGVEIGEHIRSLEVFSPDTGCTKIRRPAVEFSYRSCRVPGITGWWMVRAVTLVLRRDEPTAIRARMADAHAKKKSTQPIGAWSAGSAFKNPSPDAPAGRLLEEAGLKGKAVGGMRFSPVHANFLVNEGQGSFAQAMELIALARDRVREHSGFELELEVRVWP